MKKLEFLGVAMMVIPIVAGLVFLFGELLLSDKLRDKIFGAAMCCVVIGGCINIYATLKK